MIATALVAPGSVTAQSAEPAGPDTVTFAAARGTVVFTHGKHAQLSECRSCHHDSRAEKPATEEYMKCSACHTTPASEPMTTTLRNAFHDTVKREGVCYNCHREEAAKGTAVPAACADCHAKPGGVRP